MLRRFCSAGSGSYTGLEAMAIDQLCTSHRRMQAEGGLAGLSGEDGYAACAAFLVCIDRAARTLTLPPASRAYRSTFSANYRALFPDASRLYRVDVLETSVDQHSEIWVNGDKFELSPEAIGQAEALQAAWAELSVLLERWEQGPEDDRPSRTEMTAVLVTLDIAWAQFECRYITELIAIEDRARQLVVRASQLDGRLRRLQRQGSPECEDLERELVRCIAHLNSVANFKCKGRDDLGYDILESAYRVMKRCNRSRKASGRSQAALDAAWVLAVEVIESYEAMRNYLCQVGTCIERVDPHLCNNIGLVARLVDWETSWEVGARYVREASLLDAVCDVVSEIKGAQGLVPVLMQMCEDCDVELFLVLPRMVLILFVADPAGARAVLLESLLPHRFDKGRQMHQELDELVHRSEEALTSLSAAVGRDAAWQLVVKRAVAGDFQAQDLYMQCPQDAQILMEGLMRDIERWSLELQRHCPQDWNQCSAVLVQCLMGKQKKPNVKFQV